MIPDRLAELARRVGMLLRRRKLDAELAEEMRLHLELREASRRAEGASAEEARRGARVGFGNPTLLAEESRAVWSWPALDTFVQDLRYAGRGIRRSPGAAAIAVVSLALGIGANAAVFGLVDALVLRRLPVDRPEEIYRWGDEQPCCVVGGVQGSFSIFSYPAFRDLASQAAGFRSLAAFEARTETVVVRSPGRGAARPIRGEIVSGGYFPTFGVSAIRGRMLEPSDDVAGAPPTAVVSHRLWKQEFGGSDALPGSVLVVDGIGFTIAGIAPPGFFGETLRSDPPDVWLPLAAEPLLHRENSILEKPGAQWLYVIGRLPAGANPEAPERALTLALQRWVGAHREFLGAEEADVPKQHIRLTPAGRGVPRLRETYSAGLKLLTTVSMLVLLMTGTNVAMLQIARAAARRRDRAVREALGASFGRLLRQSLVESGLVALAGGVAALAVATLATRGILAWAFRGSRYVPIDVRPSATVLVISFLLSAAAAIVFGLLTTVRDRDLARALADGRSIGRSAPALRRDLVVFQVAVSVVLLSAAIVLSRSLSRLEHQPFGFRLERRVVLGINPAQAGFSLDRLGPLYLEIRRRLSRMPEVAGVALSLNSPMSGGNWSSPIAVEGAAPPRADGSANATWNRVSAGYFETLGIPLVRGRSFDDRDSPEAPRTAIVNRTFARKFLGGRDPIGLHVGFGDPGAFEIVGVVDDTKDADPYEPFAPTAYFPLLQMTPGMRADNVQVRSNFAGNIEIALRAPSPGLERRVRDALGGIAPDLSVLEFTPLKEQVERNFNQERLLARLSGAYGGLALLLVCVGLYGIASYSVVQRAREIGVRMALGAQRTEIRRMVVRESAKRAVAGIVVGIPPALAVVRLARARLYGVDAGDPITFLAVSALLLGIGAAAGILPARRAAGVDPIRALRES